MLTELSVQGIRGITKAELTGLSAVTMLVGPNGCGKSTMLEAVALACAGNTSAAFACLATREWLGPMALKYLWSEPNSVRSKWDGEDRSAVMGAGGPVDAELDAMARGRGLTGDVHVVRFNGYPGVIDEDGVMHASRTQTQLRPIPCTMVVPTRERPVGARKRFGSTKFSSSLRGALAQVKLTPWYEDLITYLREARPSLDAIESLALGDRDEPHLIEKGPRVGYPLAFAGDGFQRAMEIAGALAEVKGGVVTIDEPEVYAHPRMFGSIAKLTKRAVADGTQVVMATHSLEFVQAVLTTFEDDLTKCCVVGLSNEGGVISSTTIAGPDASRRVLELGQDLRL